MLSKEIRFPTAIESLKRIVFVRNKCTPAAWRKSFTSSSVIKLLCVTNVHLLRGAKALLVVAL